MPGVAPPRFISTSRSARPMVALARWPGPKRLAPELISNCCAICPLTMISGAAPPVLAVEAWGLTRSLVVASTAAMTTGAYAGRQPAMTALMAIFSAVITLFRCGMAPTMSSGCLPEDVQELAHPLLGGRNDGEPVGPPLLEVHLDRLDRVRNLKSLGCKLRLCQAHSFLGRRNETRRSMPRVSE